MLILAGRGAEPTNHDHISHKGEGRKIFGVSNQREACD